MGIQPHAYQVKLSLEHAEALLLGTALSVGYVTSESLARAFNRTRGCTPSEFTRIRH
jgi:AraC-like DNA-binding protein